MTTLTEKAAKFAIEKHKNQKRKLSGICYAFHPGTVAWLLTVFKESTNRDKLVAALLLHDTIEDCDVSFSEIEREFGTNIASIVMELTNDKTITDKDEQKERMIQKLLTMSNYGLACKLCDILHNLSDVDGARSKFGKQFIKKTTIYIDALESGRKLTASQKRIVDEIKKMLLSYK